jgi:UPF0755 protein
MALQRRPTRIKTSKKYLVISILVSAIVISGLLVALSYYRAFFSPNVILKEEKEHFIYIPNQADFEMVVTLIANEKILKNTASFKSVAQQKRYHAKIKGGRYRVTSGMSNHQLINLLISGRQTPVRLTFNNLRTREDLARVVSQKLEADSAHLVSLLYNDEFMKRHGMTAETALVLFIPNTYEFYWNTSAEGFIERMAREYKHFWTEERKAKAAAAELSLTEVSILAAIVDEETIKNDEKSTVAGLYINRLRKGIRLQADPTIKHALGNFQVKRILGQDLEIDSPYNTYIYAGLPPGPIRIPSVSGIDAVLNYEHHDYLYMCAREDFSGYHHFARTLDQHNRYAAKYRRALRDRNIWR